MNRREFNKKTLGSICGLMVMPFLPKIIKPAKKQITLQLAAESKLDLYTTYDNAYGVHLNITTDWLKDFIKTHQAKHSVEILIEIDGEQKEFTLAEFKAKLGLSGKSV